MRKEGDILTSDMQTYTVVEGDTLTGIAAKFGIADSQTLYEANKDVVGPDPNLIQPGQVLTIPETELEEHYEEFAEGDTDEQLEHIHRMLHEAAPTKPKQITVAFGAITITTQPEGTTQEVHPMSVICTPNDTIEGNATAKDADGDVLTDAVTFATSDPAILTVVDNGNSSYKATAVALGSAQIVATAGANTAALDVTVQTGPAATTTFGEPVVTAVNAP